MSPDDRVRLRHMADAIEAASQFSEGRSRNDLDTDRMLVFALVRAVEIIGITGEAASRVSSGGRAALPTVPWSNSVGMRNRLIHAYFGVDLDILWNTVTEALPPLGQQIGAALGDAPRGTDG
jgi:uncharacterized protein with HEPN domain